MEAFYEIFIIIWGILSLILFFKVWGMTNDVNEMNKRITNDVSALRDKFCNRVIDEKDLTRDVIELKTTGKIDEAKNLVDESFKTDIFDILLARGKSMNYIKEHVEDVIVWYEKYYRILNVEMPAEIKNIDVEKILEQYDSLSNK